MHLCLWTMHDSSLDCQLSSRGFQGGELRHSLGQHPVPLQSWELRPLGIEQVSALGKFAPTPHERRKELLLRTGQNQHISVFEM